MHQQEERTRKGVATHRSPATAHRGTPLSMIGPMAPCAAASPRPAPTAPTGWRAGKGACEECARMQGPRRSPPCARVCASTAHLLRRGVGNEASHGSGCPQVPPADCSINSGGNSVRHAYIIPTGKNGSGGNIADVTPATNSGLSYDSARSDMQTISQPSPEFSRFSACSPSKV